MGYIRNNTLIKRIENTVTNTLTQYLTVNIGRMVKKNVFFKVG